MSHLTDLMTPKQAAAVEAAYEEYCKGKVLVLPMRAWYERYYHNQKGS